MARFMLLTFAFLGWAFYEMSGGSDFEPGWYIESAEAKTVDPAEMPAVEVAEDASAEDPAPMTEIVARAETSPETFAVIQTAAPASSADAAPVVKASLRTDEPAPEAQGLRVTTRSTAASFDSNVVIGRRQPANAVATSTGSGDVREVAGSRVNMRNGPGTNFSVVDSLSRGARVEVIDEPGNGWLKLRVVSTEEIGWMADYLVTASN
ncbi:SH3 domain-containing protein [Litorisediminicola beolgyonensis]|uniref:SH3 domain-containing protein n=1 Tax=Litorisediminicola beolgyonensis TaxID=1173614 RepID=A0ABW3ZKN4_9RHOB